MMIELDLRSHVPIYVQIVERIEHLVAAGVLQPEDQLPTVRQMAADLRVNFNTIARAYRMLDEAGVISTQQGRGTYVLQPPPPEQALALRQAALQSLVDSFVAEAARMALDVDDVALAVEQRLAAWRETGQPLVEDGPSVSNAIMDEKEG